MDDDMQNIIQILCVFVFFICVLVFFLYFTFAQKNIPTVTKISNGSTSISENKVNKVNNSFDKLDDQYDGNSLLPDKCLKNVTLYDCLGKCTQSKDCVGADWNPIILENVNSTGDQCMYKDNIKEAKYYPVTNVCCLLKNINKQSTRTNKFKNGSFYMKNNSPINGSESYTINLRPTNYLPKQLDKLIIT